MSEINLLYRADSHLMLWHVVEDAGYWKQLGASVQFTYCDTPQAAEAALIAEEADFVSGNHVTPYLRKAEGVPVVCVGQPWKHVTDVLISRKPLERLKDARGMTIVDRPLKSPAGGIVHPRGNHVLYLEREGIDADRDVRWEDRADLRKSGQLIEAVRSGVADAAFIGQHEADEAVAAGLQILALDPLPMVHGPTLTAYAPHLRRHPSKATLAIQGLAMGMDFFRRRPEETKAILRRHYPKKSDKGIEQSYAMVVENCEPTMYPHWEAIQNAFRLAQMAYGERVATVNPISVWDIHYLRELDDAGFFSSLDERAG